MSSDSSNTATLLPLTDHEMVAETPPLVASRREKRIAWAHSMPFLIFHAAAIVAPFFVSFSWGLVGLCFGLFFLRMFGITAGYHRYFSHRSYKTNRPMQFVMAFLGGMSAQKGALWWAANHRHHHKHSDDEEDLHSPKQDGFFWSHVGWVLSPDHLETRWELIPDLAKYPELVFLNRHHWIPPITLAVILLATGGWAAFVWGFLVSTVLLWHGTFTINSLSHVYGSQRYESGDTSRNNFWLALVTMGEGWHNNHHAYMSSTRQGFFWWEVDMSYYALKLLSCFGLVGQFRKPPLQMLEAKRLGRKSS